ncbi:MAG: PHP domain-containing protein [Clostridia bacterium]|nr:PHP domain-containing protein [Clostridia bacterium]
MKADLHIHSYYSDGGMSPAEALSLAKANGVDLIALTDHDTMAGCGEIAAVRGVEISAYDNDTKVHVLCYNPNGNIDGFLKSLFEGSFKRTEDIIYKLNMAGVAITFDEVEAERFSRETPIHAMHIARVGARKGYASTPFAFYEKYLALGGAAFSNIFRPSPEEAVEVINAAGGLSSLAHPGRIDLPPEELKKLIKRMKLCGLGGIEAVYSSHTFKETAYYKELAKEYGLLITGGSDTHYKGGSKTIGEPDFQPSEELLQKLGI